MKVSQIQPTAGLEILGERLHHRPEDAVLVPPLKAPMTRLIRRTPLGKSCYGAPVRRLQRSRSARRVGRATGVRAGRGACEVGQDRRENRPLRVSQVHTLAGRRTSVFRFIVPFGVYEIASSVAPGRF